MKKLLSLCLMVLGLFLSIANPPFAEAANWWGEYCTENKETCVHISNVDINRMGIAHFSAYFVDSQKTELCYMVPAMDDLKSRSAGFMFYELILSADDDTLTITHYPDTEIDPDDGCTAALFGTYTRPQDNDDPCPRERSDLKMTTVTVKKVFEAYHILYMTFDNNGKEETIQIEYDNEELYKQFVGKTVQMEYWDVQYFDEHDGECVQTKDVNTLDNVGIPKG